jgi:hypothetical protein
VGKAKAAGLEIIGDVELFCRERLRLAPGAPFIAITGTNGKSTTTALIAHILRQTGRDVQIGGNIGTPILDLLERDDVSDVGGRERRLRLGGGGTGRREYKDEQRAERAVHAATLRDRVGEADFDLQGPPQDA